MQNKKLYFENLDGWRFLCFLSVFFFHSFHTEFKYIKEDSTYHFFKKHLFGNGNLGVNFFFVLSGFLITYLIIQEFKKNNRIDVVAFWKRRILRIWPLFYFCVFFGFVIFPILKQSFGQTSNETAYLPMYLSFLNNFDLIHQGLPDASILGVLWSVAIEEQFYFVWPLLLFFVPLRHHWAIFITIIITSIAFRIFNNSELLYEHHTLSCVGDLAIGGLGAWCISNSKKFFLWIENISKTTIYLVYIGFILIFIFRDEVFLIETSFKPFERIVIALFILLIILEQNYSKHSFYKMSRFKRISSLGKMTYGMYCLHFIGILVALKITSLLGINKMIWQVLILETTLALLITIAISKLSYSYFELPFLELKNRFSKI
jgi:peptidoglycan/LPS O-acetylase OafA/YrhL